MEEENFLPNFGLFEGLVDFKGDACVEPVGKGRQEKECVSVGGNVFQKLCCVLRLQALVSVKLNKNHNHHYHHSGNNNNQSNNFGYMMSNTYRVKNATIYIHCIKKSNHGLRNIDQVICQYQYLAFIPLS